MDQDQSEAAKQTQMMMDKEEEEEQEEEQGGGQEQEKTTAKDPMNDVPTTTAATRDEPAAQRAEEVQEPTPMQIAEDDDAPPPPERIAPPVDHQNEDASAGPAPPSCVPVMMTQVFDNNVDINMDAAMGNTIADAFTEAEKVQEEDTQQQHHHHQQQQQQEEAFVEEGEDEDQAAATDGDGDGDGGRDLELERRLASFVDHLRRCRALGQKKNVLELLEPTGGLVDYFGCSTEEEELRSSETYTKALHKLAQDLTP
jgi:hypothetical protein